jgi:hypothetical protein
MLQMQRSDSNDKVLTETVALGVDRAFLCRAYADCLGLLMHEWTCSCPFGRVCWLSATPGCEQQ